MNITSQSSQTEDVIFLDEANASAAPPTAEEHTKDESSHSNVKTICKSTNVTTSVSLLIESLVKSLCTIVEPDQKRSLMIYNAICSKLYQMKLIDESYNMKEFEGVRSQYETALYHLLMNAKNTEGPMNMPMLWPLNNDWSHYSREFEEVEFIAGGGFGHVFKVRHRLDGTEYAVKKIFIRSKGIKSVMKYLSEVKTFASLNHPNIVQYKAAWLELGTVNELSYGNIEANDEVSNNFTEGEASEDNMAVYKYKVIPKWATLYIQMTLCSQTLRHWLDDKRSQSLRTDSNVIMEILRQLLNGLSYIHSKGIVHHDVKPSNIFVLQEADSSLTVQLGDFGLACPLQNDKHSLALGTRMYAAPEQLAGECNGKSDLYSLGICLLEMSTCSSTDMERAARISALRKTGTVPEEVPEQIALLVKELTQESAEKRPTADELLQRITVDEGERIQLLEKKLVEKDREIERLKSLLTSHGIQC